MGAILVFIALLILFACSPFVFIYTIIKLAVGSSFSKWWKDVNAYLRDVSFYIDVLGCIAFQYALNVLFVKSGGVLFGLGPFTISHILKLNRDLGTLTKAGRFMCAFLDSIDKDHISNSLAAGNKISFLRYFWINTNLAYLLYLFIAAMAIRGYIQYGTIIALPIIAVVLIIAMPVAFYLQWRKL